MGIIDELATETGYSPKKKEAGEKEFRPSSYNPLYAYPENLAHLLGGASKEIGQGAEELGKGEYLSGAFHVGMGGLEGAWSPVTAGVQNVTQPLSDVSGIPEWMLTTGAMVGPAAYRGLAGGARKLMGIGGKEATAEAAPAVEAASAATAESRIGATNREQWLKDYEGRKESYFQKVGGGRMAQMEEAAGRTPPVSPAERFFPAEVPIEETRAAPGEFGYTKKPWASPEKGPAEEMMFGGRRMFPEQQLPSPAIRLPDQRQQWAKPTAESAYLMGGLPKWQKPGNLPAEEMMFGGRRMMPEQQLPDYTLQALAKAASQRSGQMRGEQEAFRGAIPQMDYGARPTRQIERPAPLEMAAAPLSKAEKLSKLSELEPSRRFFGEQASPQALRTMTGVAAERAGQAKGLREETRASRLPETRRTRQIRPKAEETRPSLSKEQKLQTLESEGMRSLYDAVRTLETSGMDSAEAEQHILNNIRAGHMTAVKANGAPLSAKEAKKLKSLSGLGGVTWVRG